MGVKRWQWVLYTTCILLFITICFTADRPTKGNLTRTRMLQLSSDLHHLELLVASDPDTFARKEHRFISHMEFLAEDHPEVWAHLDPRLKDEFDVREFVRDLSERDTAIVD